MGASPHPEQVEMPTAGRGRRTARRCRVTPIARRSRVADHDRMSQLAIRCHPCAPVSAEELERWLEGQTEALRADLPHAIARISRLTQARDDGELSVGWLVELDLPDGETPLAEKRLADALRDMRLLGLQPTLLAPQRVTRIGAAAC
jgi:hypothetical protein